MRKVFQVFLLLFRILLLFTVFVTLMAIVISANPGLLINSSSLRFAARLAEGQGYRVNWESMKIQFEPVTWFSKKLILSTRDFCVEVPEQGFSGCFERLRIGMILDLKAKAPFIKEIGPVLARSNQVLLRTQSNEDSEDPVPKSDASIPFLSFVEVPFWLKEVKLSDLDLEVASLKILREPARSKAKTANLEKVEVWQGSFSVRNSKEALIQDSAVKAALHLKLADHSHLNILAEIEPFSSSAAPVHSATPGASEEASPSPSPPSTPLVRELRYRVKSEFKKAKREWAFDVSGRVNNSTLNFRGSASGKNLTSELKSITLKECDWSLTRVGGSSSPDHIQFSCPTRVELSDSFIGFSGRKRGQKDGHAIDLVLDGEFKTSLFSIQPESEINGTLSAQVSEFLYPMIEGKGRVEVKVGGKLSQFPAASQIGIDPNLEFHIPHFEKLSRALRGMIGEIPAPFHVLRGSADLSIRGHSNLNPLEIPITLRTHLSSVEQRAWVQGEGTLRILQEGGAWSSKLDLDLSLTDVRLAVPRMGFHALPRVFPDSRFRRVSESDSGIPLQYRIGIKTMPQAPLRLISNLAKESIPVVLDIEVDDTSGVRGTVHVDRFPMNLFRREVTLKHMNLKLTDPARKSEMDGWLNVKYADYNITIQILSTLEKPTLHVFSDPPLSESQVWAGLIFGKPLEELDSDQMNSINDLEHTVEQRAMDLASLYFLASTPVQSISYDPVSKSVQAKIRIGSGTSLNLDTEMSGVKTIGIRKRLGRNWVIETHIDQPGTRENRSLSTYIQWNFRH